MSDDGQVGMRKVRQWEAGEWSFTF
jgi:hypothetical protein